jgi:hypothetical protein
MCGNFGLLANRLPENNRELLPPTLVEMFYKMGHQTEVRREQAGGGLTLARNKDNQVVFVGKKLVNQKRKNLTKSLEAAFAPVRKSRDRGHQAIRIDYHWRLSLSLRY